MSAAPITYTMPTAQPCVRQRLATLNERIIRTRGEISRLRCQLADKRMQLNVECGRRAQLSAEIDNQFLDTVTDETLEAALSKPGPLVEKLATAMHIVAEEEEADPAAAPQESTIESDGDFADRIVAEATAERNEALSEYAQALRKQEEAEAMEALNGDDACDSNGQA